MGYNNNKKYVHILAHVFQLTSDKSAAGGDYFVKKVTRFN